jgi:hypothetical protein
MALIKRFEDILAWQEARKLVNVQAEKTKALIGGLKKSLKPRA